MKTALEIINDLDSNFPRGEIEEIKNLSDINIGNRIDIFNQYIFGVTPHDAYSTSRLDQYENKIKKALSGNYANLKFIPIPFSDYELEEVKTVLTDLSSHYHANLDVNRMLKELNIKETDNETYYLVITVVQIPIISAT